MFDKQTSWHFKDKNKNHFEIIVVFTEDKFLPVEHAKFYTVWIIQPSARTHGICGEGGGFTICHV